jgi:hypothetical protein
METVRDNESVNKCMETVRDNESVNKCNGNCERQR